MLKYLLAIKSSDEVWFEFFGAHDASSAKDKMSDAEYFINSPCFNKAAGDYIQEKIDVKKMWALFTQSLAF